MNKFEIRAVGKQDADHLWIALGYAIEWSGSKPDLAQVRS